MTDVFTKQPREPRSAEAEAAGLQWLAEASDCVATVVAVDPGSNTLQTALVTEVQPTAAAARRAGREIARIHLAGAPAFGAPPPGWDGPNYIGTREQECTPTERWGEFYVNQRVLPFAQQAREVGNLDEDGYGLVAQACAAIVAADPDVTPARIHGDLWAGNLLFGEQGPVIIDPAAHGGHPLTDLAMLSLFGPAFPDEIWAGYREISELPDDFRDDFPMHQLHPLAVHAWTHGRGYARPLIAAARSTLERLA